MTRRGGGPFDSEIEKQVLSTSVKDSHSVDDAVQYRVSLKLAKSERKYDPGMEETKFERNQSTINEYISIQHVRFILVT